MPPVYFINLSYAVENYVLVYNNNPFFPEFQDGRKKFYIFITKLWLEWYNFP